MAIFKKFDPSPRPHCRTLRMLVPPNAIPLHSYSFPALSQRHQIIFFIIVIIINNNNPQRLKY